MRRHTRGKVGVGTIALLLAVALPYGASGARKADPVARGDWKCHLDSPSHKARLWWNEKRGSEHTIPERIETVSSTEYTPPQTDGNCATPPELVTYLARQIDGLLRRNRAIGLPAPAPDRGMPATWGDPSRLDKRVVDGGSAALDVYLWAGRVGVGSLGGSTECVYWWPKPKSARATTAAYVQLYAVRTTTRRDLDEVVHNAAHELVHAAQCAVRNRSGLVNGTTLDNALVEGSAEAFAVASSGKLVESMLQWAQTRPSSVLLPASRATGNPYSLFPFWYELFRAPSAKRYVSFLRSAVAANPREHRLGDANLVYRAFGETAVQRALTSFASFAVLGGRIGGVDYAARTPHFLMYPSASRAQWIGSSAISRVRLEPGAYKYVVVEWPDGASELTVSAANVAASRALESVVVGSRDGGRATSNGGTWTIPRAGTSDGVVYIAVANGRRTPLSLIVNVEAR